jgi:TonB family protein
MKRFIQVSENNRGNASSSPGSDGGSSPTILLANGIIAPRAIYAPEPEYTDEALKAKLVGTVVLSLVVGTDGQPRDIKVVRPLRDGLDQKAVDAVKSWKFQPATKDGKPVAVQITVEVQFRLQ